MKQLSLIISLVCLFLISNAKIWRVSNNSGIVADFITAQAANDAPTVLNGDTIHLEPSESSYGNLTCTKRLIWISTGYFLNIHPGQQFSPNTGRVDILTVNAAGSANSVFSINAAASNISASGVRFERCFFNGLVQMGLDAVPANIVVTGCYIKNGIALYYGSNYLLTNCIIENFVAVTADCSAVTITQNVIGATAAGGNDIHNSDVENNIFNKADFAYTFTNCVVQYNMSAFPGILPTGNHNQNGVNMSTVFVNNNGADDASFVLKAESPAIGAGSGTPAADLGAFGGITPFKIALQPAIPSVYKLAAKVTGTGNPVYTITFSTRSNN